jgi:hypothetical protein
MRSVPLKLSGHDALSYHIYSDFDYSNYWRRMDLITVNI